MGCGRGTARLLDDDRRRLDADLSEDLRDAWERLRETASEFGDQRVYASHNSIMFSRKSCYFFVRPKKSFLEVCLFLGRPLKAPQILRLDRTSKTKFFHILRITHRDEVEAPITDWLQEAYDFAAYPLQRGSPQLGKARQSGRRGRARQAVLERLPRGSGSGAEDGN